MGKIITSRLFVEDDELVLRDEEAQKKIRELSEEIVDVNNDLKQLGETTKNKFTKDIVILENGLKFNNSQITNTDTDPRDYVSIYLHGYKDGSIVETYATNKILEDGSNLFYFNVTQEIDTIVLTYSGSSKNFDLTIDVSGFITTGYHSLSFEAISLNPSTIGGIRFDYVQLEKGGRTAFEYPICANDNVARKMIDDLNKSIDGINTKIQKMNYSVKNDLYHDGINAFTFATDVFKNGESNDSNYGLDDVSYRITLPEYEKIHGYFEFQFTKAVPYISQNNPLGLFKIGASAVTGNVYLNEANVKNSYIYRAGLIGQNNAYIGQTTKEYSAFTTNSIKGDDAFYVKYTGSGTNASMIITESSITFKNDSITLGVITFSSTESIASLIEKLSALTFIECGFVNTLNKTCGELLFNASIEIPLTYTFNETLDKPRVYIPYAYDAKWHTCEFVFDKETMKSYFAFNGFTIESSVSKKAFGTIYDNYLYIGGIFNDSESPVRIRNLELDINSFGNAEIVHSIASPYEGIPQLISNHNPRLLIFEGHGIDIRKDTDDIPAGSDDMACSTDRLCTVFEELTKKGYEPVTYEQIVDWKVNGKSLPKRCFNLMFDDYRIENYLDYGKRFPFTKYNVKAGLAIISDSKETGDEIVVDGTTYTVNEAFNAIKNGGWYPCSHTNTHTAIDDILPSALPQKLKECVISCDKHNIYSDIIVYPLGKVSARSLSALENSDFSIGINIVTNRYNCRALPNMNLTRVEIGTRESLENVLASIV